MDLNDPTTVALLAAEAFAKASIRHAVCGGLLVAAYGEPRETRDADFAVVELAAADAARALRTAGVEIQVAFEDVTFGGLVVSRLTLLGSQAFTGLNTIDLVRPRSARYAREAVARAPAAVLRGTPVHVLAPEDFIVFKVLSTRERDLEDAASALRRSAGAIDRRQIDRENEILAGELPDFEVKARYARLPPAGGQP